MWNDRERSSGDASLPPDLMNVYSEKMAGKKSGKNRLEHSCPGLNLVITHSRQSGVVGGWQPLTVLLAIKAMQSSVAHWVEILMLLVKAHFVYLRLIGSPQLVFWVVYQQFHKSTNYYGNPKCLMVHRNPTPRGYQAAGGCQSLTHPITTNTKMVH